MDRYYLRVCLLIGGLDSIQQETNAATQLLLQQTIPARRLENLPQSAPNPAT